MNKELKSFIICYGVPHMVLQADGSSEYNDLIDPIIHHYPLELSIERTILQVINLNDGTVVFMYECIYSYRSDHYPRRHIESRINDWISKIESSMENYLNIKNIPYSKL